MFEGATHHAADAHDSDARHPAPGKRTLSERLPVSPTGRVSPTDPVSPTNPVSPTAHDDPFAMHLIGGGEQPADDGHQRRVADARAFNLQHTREVVRFNQLTRGFYAPPGGGQFDPEDIMAWQGDPERKLPQTGQLDTVTMERAELEMKSKGNVQPLPRKNGSRPKSSPQPDPSPSPQPNPSPSPQPNPSPQPAPDPEVRYPEFEDLADAVWNAMHYLMLATRDGVTRAAAELKTHDQATKFNKHAGTFLKEASKESVKETAQALVGAVFSEALDFLGKGWIAGVAAQVEYLWESVLRTHVPRSQEPPPDSKVDVFAQAQIRATTNASFQAEEDFLLGVKPAYRAEERARLGAGVAMMSRDLSLLRAKRAQAESLQHQQALHRWTLALAHEDAGEYRDPETHQSQGTKLVDDKDKMKIRTELRNGRGVLKVRFVGWGPDNGVHIESVELHGVPSTVRDQLVGKTFDEANLPLVADGRVLVPGDYAPFTVSLAAGEAHTQVIDGNASLKQYFIHETTGDTDAAQLWLARRAHPRIQSPTYADARDGARRLLYEAITTQHIPPFSA